MLWLRWYAFNCQAENEPTVKVNSLNTLETGRGNRIAHAWANAAHISKVFVFQKNPNGKSSQDLVLHFCTVTS